MPRRTTWWTESSMERGFIFLLWPLGQREDHVGAGRDVLEHGVPE